MWRRLAGPDKQLVGHWAKHKAQSTGAAETHPWDEEAMHSNQYWGYRRPRAHDESHCSSACYCC
jgi:hypothetical protein